MSNVPKAPSPQELREGMVADYAEHVQRAGGTASIADIERIVAADLQIFDAVERERRAAPPPAAKPDKREDTAKIIAHSEGMELYRKQIGADSRDPLLDKDPRRISAKFPAMMARIKRIVAPRGNTRQRSFSASLEEMAAPKLAREFLNLFICYRAPSMPVKGNPFRDVANPRDRARIFLRKVEDICDRSTGSMGPWWVK